MGDIKTYNTKLIELETSFRDDIPGLVTVGIFDNGTKYNGIEG